MNECFKCKKTIKNKDKPFMYAIDKPYVNLWFHRECYDEIVGRERDYFLHNYEELNQFIKEKNMKK